MTSVRITPASRSHPDTAPDGPRLTMKPGASTTGAVDGGWWPRSRDLVAEVPALLTGLAARLGVVEGVTYNLDEWEPAPAKITIDGSRVRLAGYRSQHPSTIGVHGLRHRVTLLVLAPESSAPVADAALAEAARLDNADGVEALLRAHETRTSGGRPTAGASARG